MITDSFGRAWRKGQCEIAIGCAGLAPLDDWRGRPDNAAASCTPRVIAIADEAAAAADLVRGKDLARARGARSAASSATSPRTTARARPALLRGPRADDLFR